jgi:hypothetical protein
LSSRRRFVIGFAFLVSILACAGGYAVWRWKASSVVQERLQRLTGRPATIGGLSFNRHFELVAHDVRIAGAPPFQSQTVARAAEVVVRLRGPSGFWSASEVIVDGLDLEYLGTPAGDNLLGMAARTKAALPRGKGQPAVAPPRILVRNARAHGSFALPYGPHLEFRVPKAEFERDPDGHTRASLHDLIVDAQGWGSLRAQTVQVDLDHERLLVTSSGPAALDIPGGGTWLDHLVLSVKSSAAGAEFELRSNATPSRPFLLTGRWQGQTAEISLDAQDLSLRALGALAARGTSPGRQFVGLENARASLRASLTVDRPSLRADYQLDGKLASIDLLHPAIDALPWRNQNASLSLRGHIDLGALRIEIAQGSLEAFAARLSLQGWLEPLRTPRGSFTLATPRNRPLSCAALLLGQPKPVQQALAGLEVEGHLGFAASVEFDASDWDGLKLAARFDPLCKVTSEAQSLANLLPILRDADAATAVSTNLPLGPFHPDFTPLKYMSRYVPSAFLAAEDSRFFTHHGFDLEMIRHALAQDLENRSFDRGASTITQQLAKNLFLSSRRTLARKIEEAILTWRLQNLLSKDRILELYLNVIELGPGIRGVKQAARAYFNNKGASNITPLEAAHLAALTPNPHVLARRFRDGQVDEGWQQRLYDLLGSMRRNGRLSPAELAEARSTKLVLRDRSQDGAAPPAH